MSERGEPLASKSKRRLGELPDHGAVLGDLRDWLTTAIGPRPGYRVEEFIRAGRQRRDPCTLVLSTPDGGRVRFRFPEQRELSVAGSLRAAVHAYSDGLCHVPALSKPELEDVWAALCTLAKVLVDQDDRDEAREWWDGCATAAACLTGYSLDDPARRGDALAELQRQPRFTRSAAIALGDPNGDRTRPTLLIDAQSGALWLRAGELATYIRHVVGAGPLSQSTLDGRVAELGIERRFLEVRRMGDRRGEHPHAVLYRKPDEQDAE